MADNIFNVQAIGVGNAAETIFETNGTITVPRQQRLKITDYVLDFHGAGIIRIRETDISGAIVHQRRVSADGEIISDLNTPLLLSNPGSTDKNFVITYQGPYVCAVFLSGTYDTTS